MTEVEFELDLQFPEKWGGMREVSDEIRHDIRGSRGGQRTESTDMRGYQKERVIAIRLVIRLLEADVQGEGPRAFDIGVGLVDIQAIQMGP